MSCKHLKAFATRAEFERRRGIVIAADSELEKLIAEAPDWRTFPGYASTKEWRRQQELKASRNALALGVEYFGGIPAVPKVLADLLGGETIETDGRHVPTWYGSLVMLDSRIADLNAQIGTLQQQRDAHLRQAEALIS